MLQNGDIFFAPWIRNFLLEIGEKNMLFAIENMTGLYTISLNHLFIKWYWSVILLKVIEYFNNLWYWSNLNNYIFKVLKLHDSMQ